MSSLVVGKIATVVLLVSIAATSGTSAYLFQQQSSQQQVIRNDADKVASLNKQIDSLNTQISSLNTQISQLQALNSQVGGTNNNLTTPIGISGVYSVPVSANATGNTWFQCYDYYFVNGVYVCSSSFT